MKKRGKPMTAKQKAALKKAQKASARARKNRNGGIKVQIGTHRKTGKPVHAYMVPVQQKKRRSAREIIKRAAVGGAVGYLAAVAAHKRSKGY